MSDSRAQYAGLLFIGDPHVAHRPPGFRKDDFTVTVLGKLRFALDYAREQNLMPVLLGDLFDVAHNADGARVLADTLRVAAPERPLTALVAVLADKDWRGILSALAPVVDHFVLTVAPTAPPNRLWDVGAAHAFVRRGRAFRRRRLLLLLLCGDRDAEERGV